MDWKIWRHTPRGRASHAISKSKWRAKNLEKCRAKQRIYQAVYEGKKRAASCGDVAAIAKVYSRAQALKKWFDVVVDHIVPLSKGGAHSADNLQIIYAKENLIKNDRLAYKPVVIFI